MKKRSGSLAVFLDRDGTLLKERGYLSDPKKIRFYPGVFPPLKALTQAKIKLVIVTNQSGVGRGFFTTERLNEIHHALKTRLRKKGVAIAGIYFCPHHPAVACVCRKPKITLPKRAARALKLNLKKSYVVGDQMRDLEMARRLGAKGILVLTGAGQSGYGRAKRIATKVTKTLSSACQWILRDIAI